MPNVAATAMALEPISPLAAAQVSATSDAKASASLAAAVVSAASDAKASAPLAAALALLARAARDPREGLPPKSEEDAYGVPARV